jgi:hypothetical protein
MRNMDVRRSLVIAVATLAFAGGGTSLVLASGGGSALHSGPDKTDGVAGASGQHTGQPPKDQSRGDCPNPPGQQGNTTGTGNNNVSSSTSTSSNGNKKK